MPTPLVVIACVVNGGAGDFANTVAQEFDRVCVCAGERCAEHAWDSSVECVWHSGQSMCWQC